MVEPIATAVLSAALMKVASDYLSKAVDGGIARLGEAGVDAVGSGMLALWSKVKDAVMQRGATRAVERFEAAPAEARLRNALAIDVEEALDAEPALREGVRLLIDRLGGAHTIINQTSTQAGRDNVAVQNAGNQNTINVGSRRGDE